MLTRALLLAAGWFALSLLVTLAAGVRLRRGHWLLSVAWLAVVIALGDLWAYATFGLPAEILLQSAITFVLGLPLIGWLRHWNALGQVTWITTLEATFLFIAYAFGLTAFSPLNALSYLIAFAFFSIEAAALFLALTHTYESLDVTCRLRWRRRVERLAPLPGFAPMVSLHVPAHNEPPAVVEATLRSLARLDYPNYEVLVIDNNTPDEPTWRSLAEICRELGPRFTCYHLDQWPGYKSGALNFALAQTAPEAELIGTVDADYQLDPQFLKELVPAFIQPQIGFVQTPQDYREHAGGPYRQATYYGYKYFFEVSMPSRNEHNAIIFAGTMGLIRKAALQEIGGWDEWCITEDAEASLRLLQRGYQSLYIHRSYGHGLMPYTYEGLKKQRFRWCFGGIQILRKHWDALMPWARWVDPTNRLTLAQRYYYLAGGVQWFTDVLNLLFAFFLAFGAVLSLVETGVTLRPLTGPIMLMPAVFLLLHLWRFVWVLRHRLRLSYGLALRTMYSFFSLGWTVALACMQGLTQSHGVFLRTPKSKSKSRLWRALQVTQWEALIGLTCLAAGAAAFAFQPNGRTLFLAVLLAWQSSLYLAAPYYSLMSARDDERQLQRQGDYGRPVLELRAARWVLGLVASLALVFLVVQALPPLTVLPGYVRYQPADVPPQRLVGLDPVPVEQRATPPTPTTSPTAEPTTVPAATQPPGPTAPSTPQTPAGTPSASPSPGASSATPASMPSATPSSVSPSAPTPSPAATLTPSAPTSPSPTSAPLATATPGPTATSGPTATP